MPSCDCQSGRAGLGEAPTAIRAWNTIVITSLALGKRLPQSTLVRAIAHEAGHAAGSTRHSGPKAGSLALAADRNATLSDLLCAGAEHTCCLGESCTFASSCAYRDGDACNPSGTERWEMNGDPAPPPIQTQSPCAPGNYFLMYPELTDHPNSLRLGSCSRAAIQNAVAVWNRSFEGRRLRPPMH
jgi:hypothetical protein